MLLLNAILREIPVISDVAPRYSIAGDDAVRVTGVLPGHMQHGGALVSNLDTHRGARR